MLAVVAGHIFPFTFRNGYLGVDIFFCISGYVIAPLIENLHAKQEKGPQKRALVAQFFLKRVYRLVPAVVTVVTVFIAIYFLIASIFDFKRIANQAIFTLPFFGNVGASLFQGEYFQQNLNPFVHTWSLAVEFQVYSLLALSSLLLKKSKLRKLVLSILGLLSFLIFLITTTNTAQSMIVDYYALLPRIWEILLGYYLFIERNRIKKHAQINFVSYQFALILLTLLLFSLAEIERNVATITAMIFISVLLLIVPMKESNVLQKELLQWIGNRSYSIYLIHLPLFYILTDTPVMERFSNSFYPKMAFMAILICFSQILYSKIELPYRRKPMPITSKSLNICFIATALTLALAMKMVPIAAISDLGKLGVAGREPWLQKNGCQVFGTLESRNPSPCDLALTPNSTYKSTWLLIGDSHAAMFAGSLAKAAEENESRLLAFTQYGCPFFMDKLKTTSIGAANCIAHNQNVMSWIRSNSPTKIILSSRPENITQGMDLSASELLNLEITTQDKLLLDRFSVVRIGPVPEISKRKSFIEILFPSINIANDFEVSQKYNSIWQKHSLLSEGKYINVFSIMCASDFNCNTTKLDLQYYYDDNHLNSKGAEFVISKIAFK